MNKKSMHWEYRWLNQEGWDCPKEEMDWMIVDCQFGNSIEVTIEQLLACKHNGKATYEVRAVYSEPVSSEPVDKSVIEAVSKEVLEMQTAFESKYHRDWNDPAGDDIKAIWKDAWNAAKLTLNKTED